jgi:GR25 family glycosyltransferase involved in LPS biosynthesis
VGVAIEFGAIDGAAPARSDEIPAFHACPPKPGCPHCDGRSRQPVAFDWAWLDAVYCISLKSRSDRTDQAAEELHRVGLCPHVRFYRPDKHPRSPKRGIWRSHRYVAAHALAAGCERALILEDDVLFRRRFTPNTARRIADAVARLPQGWRGFYLGHWPLAAHFAGWRILRSASLCTHAYIANRSLLEWLAQTSFSKTGIPRSRIGGTGIDSAMAVLPGMFAYYPMVATQRASPHDHIRADRPRALKAHLRDQLLTRGMRASEAVAVMLAPITWAARLLSRSRS